MTRTRLMIVFVVACGLSLHGTLPVHAGQGTDGASPGRESAADQKNPISIEQLSADDYSRRQQATMQMWRLREVSRQAVQDASHHPDPEVADRANWILRQWRRGSLPDTPPEIARLLEGNDDPEVLEELMDAGQFRAVVVAIEESAGTADRDLLHRRLAAALTRRFPVYVRLAIRDDTTMDLLRLVDLIADSKEMSVCRVQLMQELGLEVDDRSLLPSASEHWSPLLKLQSKIVVLAVLGRIDEAAEIARQSGNDSLVRVCKMLAGQWQDLAIQAVASAEAVGPDAIEAIPFWCHALVAADRCDDAEIRRQAVASLCGDVDKATDPITERSPGDDNDSDDEFGFMRQLRWKCLASHGYVEEAVEQLREIRPDAAAKLAIAAARTDLAFEILDYPYDQIDLQLANWIHAAIDAQRANGSSKLDPGVRRVLSLMHCLIAVGRDQDAWTIASRLSDSTIPVGDVRIRDYVLQSLTRTQRTDWLARLAVRPGENAITGTSEQFLILSVPDMDLTTWKSLTESMARLKPAVPFARRIQMIYSLCNGEIPRGFDPEKDFASLYEELVTGRNALPPSIRQAFVRRITPRYLNSNIVSFFARHGRAEAASNCLLTLLQRGDLEAAIMLAEDQLDHGRAEQASESYDKVWEAVAAPTTRGTYFRQSSDETHFLAKALVGQWVLSRRLAHTQQAAELERQVRLTLCSPSTELRRTLLEYLSERGETEMAVHGYRTLLPLTAFGSAESTELYDVARVYAAIIHDTDPREAARWLDLAVGGTFESTDFHPPAYISLNVFVRRWALEAAIKDQDIDAAKQHLDRIYQLDPMDIDVAERLLPMMKGTMMQDVASGAFDRIWSAGLRYLRTYPFDSMAGNNLAWVAAMNQRHLKQATRISEQAVYFEPDSAIYRDTLAELLFLAGETEQALSIERSCILDDPGQWHLHEQMEKYTKAMDGG
ncbi:tetratricopeptide repeat protein [Novipirellula artificiosorum]|uniref:Tetratricopeptide repeat protein n=1 Tax=Novipirellula artificiosorum TaxID=2528016 RepID=A0A5C6DR54_9BACT|nr:tetratricopeptide repeat protein [Novipirellula artificiosorum]TWU37239.1 hypothetical protein Poly41_33680 [Novipirellula artificiosorum]